MTNARRWSSAICAVALFVGCSSGTSKQSTSTMTTTLAQSKSRLTLTSTAFADNARIPRDYTCDAAGTIPPLAWMGVPANAARLLLNVHDPDAPVPGGFTHWTVDLLPHDGTAPPVPAGATELVKWRPPCPPPGKVHHYEFTLLALPAAGRDATAAIAKASLVGTYSR